jgi:hypothetical protein
MTAFPGNLQERSISERSTVSGRTSSRNRPSTSRGSQCSRAARNARSPGENRGRVAPSCRCRTDLVSQHQDLRVLVPVTHR